MKNGGRFYKKTMSDVPLVGKTILVRADYNVPLTKDGKISDDFRIRQSVPTIKKLLEYGCRVIIISHLGRPDGMRDMRYTLEPAAARLAQLLGQDVRFIDECVGHKVFMWTKRAPQGSVTVLENLRFHPEEEANDTEFARQLAKQTHADYFVQDGFGVVHRAHASTSAITAYVPSVAGLLLEREVSTITHAMKEPIRPLVAVLGGAKVSDKIPVIKALVPIADKIIVGGAMANTFLAHDGYAMGKSKVEDGMDTVIEDVYARIKKKVGNDKIDGFLILPVDVGSGTSLEQTATRKDVTIRGIQSDAYALDIGPKSMRRLIEEVARAKTVIWNGTLGMCEVPAFRAGSVALAEVLTGKHAPDSIIGGGDTTDFVLGWDSKKGANFPYISTGGGASLELMSGLKLPGVESLLDA